MRCKKEHISLDLPDCKIENVKFFYNFFTPDERTNDSGVPAVKLAPQSVFSPTLIKRTVPRYISVEFSLQDFDLGDLELRDNGQDVTFNPFRYERLYTDDTISISDNREYIQNENDVCSAFDESINYCDSLIRERLKTKSDLLIKILGKEPNTRQGIKAISDILSQENQQSISDLNAVISNPDATFVNDVGTEFKVLKFSKSSKSKFKIHVDKSILPRLVYSDLRSTDYSQSSLASLAKEISDSTHADLMSEEKKEVVVVNDGLAGDLKVPAPRFVRLSNNHSRPEAGSPFVTRVETHVVGYIVRRKEHIPNSSRQKIKTFYLEGSRVNRFTDTEILYGNRYFYEVAPIFRLKYFIPRYSGFNEGQYTSEEYLVSGDYSAQLSVKCIEKVPPKNPGVVFYHFDYGKEPGLMIDWRLPKSEQRDIKYFQVFRRKGIRDPFTCIALIDFDNSIIRTVPMEKVRNDNTIKVSSARTFFKDLDFNRESSYIYAVASVDAHGLTSPYSSQCLVSFNSSENVLKVRKISRSGAPKQYPNFFIDPEMDDEVAVNNVTQDVALSSGKRKIRIYFDPDCRYLATGNSTEEIIKTMEFPAFYKMHIINIDRQLSEDYEIRFEDVRGR